MAVDVTLHTLLYTVGVLLVLLIEKAFETRQEAGGLGQALVVASGAGGDSPYLCRNNLRRRLASWFRRPVRPEREFGGNVFRSGCS